MQKLAFPLNLATLTCGYKTDAPDYASLGAGAVHYGLDMVGSCGMAAEPRGFFASGFGRVLGFSHRAANTAGKWLAVLYPEAAYFLGGRLCQGDLVVRYWHLDQIFVTHVGQVVGLNTPLARWGKTGKFAKGAHLHLEVDRDWAFWRFTPSLGKADGGLFVGAKNAGDTTLNPCGVFFVRKLPPENQRIVLNEDERFMQKRALLRWSAG